MIENVNHGYLSMCVCLFTLTRGIGGGRFKISYACLWKRMTMRITIPSNMFKRLFLFWQLKITKMGYLRILWYNSNIIISPPYFDSLLKRRDWVRLPMRQISTRYLLILVKAHIGRILINRKQRPYRLYHFQRLRHHNIYYFQTRNIQIYA